MDIESSSISSRRKKKLKKKKPKSKKEIIVKKAKTTKSTGKEEMGVVDIHKFHIFPGRGRVSVPGDQWIKLMEFVQ